MYWSRLLCTFLTLCSVIGDPIDQKPKRFLLYGVNYGEGFNLRRDVYLRVANAVRQLRRKGENFHLVLSPFQSLPHWRNDANYGVFHRWSDLFDIKSMGEFVPVVELEDYIQGWGETYVLKYDVRECMDARHYYEQDSSTLWNSVLVDRAETILHDHFGDKFYWEARRSMRYNQSLVQLANDFRLKHLDSDDESDATTMSLPWPEHRTTPGQAKGGPYLAIHWRRRDFVKAHKADIPTTAGAAEQVLKALKQLNLSKVFVCTDAPDVEFDELKAILESENAEVFRYVDPALTDGQASIVDQIIAAHARHFLGTHVSTFSYRIHEDREILGLPPASTFNDLCPDDKMETGCEHPAQWTIKYESDPYFHEDL